MKINMELGVNTIQKTEKQKKNTECQFEMNLDNNKNFFSFQI